MFSVGQALYTKEGFVGWFAGYGEGADEGWIAIRFERPSGGEGVSWARAESVFAAE